MSNVAEVVHSVTVHVLADGEEGHVEVGTEIGKDSDNISRMPHISIFL